MANRWRFLVNSEVILNNSDIKNMKCLELTFPCSKFGEINSFSESKKYSTTELSQKFCLMTISSCAMTILYNGL